MHAYGNLEKTLQTHTCLYICMYVCVSLYKYSFKTNKRDYEEWSYGELNNVKKFYFQKNSFV